MRIRVRESNTDHLVSDYYGFRPNPTIGIREQFRHLDSEETIQVTIGYYRIRPLWEIIANQNNTISHLTNANADLNQLITKIQDTIANFKKYVEKLKKKIMELEEQLTYEKKLQLEDSNGSNSPLLVRK